MIKPYGDPTRSISYMRKVETLPVDIEVFASRHDPVYYRAEVRLGHPVTHQVVYEARTRDRAVKSALTRLVDLLDRQKLQNDNLGRGCQVCGKYHFWNESCPGGGIYSLDRRRPKR